MNLAEFKAWFEGFNEGVSGNPTEAQWSKIKAKIDTIKADPTPAPTIIHEYHDYLRRYYDRPWWRDQTVWMAASNNAQSMADTKLTTGYAQLAGKGMTDDTPPMDPFAMFRSMGIADAQVQS